MLDPGFVTHSPQEGRQANDLPIPVSRAAAARLPATNEPNL